MCVPMWLKKKGVFWGGGNATKPSDMGEGGQSSKGQKTTVNRHICQEIFSVFTSSSAGLSYGDFCYSGYTNTAHMQLIEIQTKI